MARPLTAIVLALSAGVSSMAFAEPPKAAYCWQILSPPIAKQSVEDPFLKTSVAASSAGEIMLAFDDNGHARTLAGKQSDWHEPAVPALGPGLSELFPVIRSGGGETYLVVQDTQVMSSNGSGSLHVARLGRSGWEFMGQPLASSRDATIVAKYAALAVTDQGVPTVAWYEFFNVRPHGIHVATWNGSDWRMVGDALPTLSTFTAIEPALALDDAGLPWVAWLNASSETSGMGSLEVERWTGDAWQAVGLDSLRALQSHGRVSGAPSLLLDHQGFAWLAWTESGRFGLRVQIAEWNGHEWQAIEPPFAARDPGSSAADAVLERLGDGSLLFAWSSRDPTSNRRIYAARRLDSEWIEVLNGLHATAGTADAADVDVAPLEGTSFAVAWHEADKSTVSRLARVYPCADGEAPPAMPRSTNRADGWPKSVDEAVDRLIKEMTPEHRKLILRTEKADLIQFHMGWGMGIRNSFGLWQGNEPLLRSCGSGEAVHPDDCSMKIIEGVWTRIRKEDGPPVPVWLAVALLACAGAAIWALISGRRLRTK